MTRGTKIRYNLVLDKQIAEMLLIFFLSVKLSVILYVKLGI